MFFISALALADVAGATWLWTLWETKHGSPASSEPGSQARLPAGTPDRHATLIEVQRARQAP
jgi:hypothetical protein